MGSCQLSCFKPLTLNVFILLINVQMPTIVGILIFMRNMKKFITSRPGEVIALNYNFSTKQKRRFKLPGHIFVQKGS